MARLRPAVLALAAASALAASTIAPATAHIIEGTETLIHVAAPGVEITFYASPQAWHRLTGGDETLPGAMLPVFAAAWAVSADGAACTPEPLQDSMAAAMDGDHVRLRLRFRCASVARRVSIQPSLPYDKSPEDIHLVRVLLADRMITGRLEGAAPRIDIPIADLLDRWQAALSPDFFAGAIAAQ